MQINQPICKVLNEFLKNCLKRFREKQKKKSDVLWATLLAPNAKKKIGSQNSKGELIFIKNGTGGGLSNSCGWGGGERSSSPGVTGSGLLRVEN